MNSILIASKDKDTRQNYILSLCEKNDIDKIDRDWQSFDKIVGIEDIRNFQKKIVLKPIKSKTKAVIIDSKNGFTIEAQNALLKTLEEPPVNTAIYITVANKNLMLSTILSRCRIIELEENSPKLSKEEIFQYHSILISLTQKKDAEKLRLAQDIAEDKDQAIPWLEKMTIAARELLLSAYEVVPITANREASINQLVSLLTSLHKAYTILKTTNANQRLVLENLLLGI